MSGSGDQGRPTPDPYTYPESPSTLMTPTVYLVSRGEYSDYGIVAAFSTSELAEAYIADVMAGIGLSRPVSRHDEMRIEDMPLDQPREELPGAWEVVVGEDGAVRTTFYRESVTASDPAKQTTEFAPGDFSRTRPIWTGYGRTVEHARRSAEELRRATLGGSVVSEPAAPPNPQA